MYIKDHFVLSTALTCTCSWEGSKYTSISQQYVGWSKYQRGKQKDLEQIIKITLIDNEGKSLKEKILDKPLHKDFVRGKSDTYTVKVQKDFGKFFSTLLYIYKLDDDSTVSWSLEYTSIIKRQCFNKVTIVLLVIVINFMIIFI